MAGPALCPPSRGGSKHATDGQRKKCSHAPHGQKREKGS